MAKSIRRPTFQVAQKIRKTLRKNILKTLELPPPKGLSCWDGGSLARVLQVPKHAVWGILRYEGIQLQRKRSLCVSTDKQFAAKSADMIGLNLNPPENALVICVDEKPTSASWLNQVEIWFGILARKALRGASFDSTESLRKAIEDFIAVYHENAKPFIWKKREVRGSQLRNTLMNLIN
jgi:phosphoribosyl-AMP cyclohydrolase